MRETFGALSTCEMKDNEYTVAPAVLCSPCLYVVLSGLSMTAGNCGKCFHQQEMVGKIVLIGLSTEFHDLFINLSLLCTLIHGLTFSYSSCYVSVDLYNLLHVPHGDL